MSWVSPDPAPIWLDLAPEYTERWHHQQHIRDAVGKPGLKQRRYLAPVIEAFCRALPRTFRHTSATEGTLVALTITGDSGGRWFLMREAAGWRLLLNVEDSPAAEVVADEDSLWRLFTRGLSKEAAREQVEIRGDLALGSQMLETVSIIA
jgi:hypothetical protein